MLWDILFAPSSDFFNNPIWSVLSGIGGIAAIVAIPMSIVIAILPSRQQRQRKELTYQVISDAPLATVNPSVKNKKIQIMLNGIPAENVRLIVLKVWNSGNSAVAVEDYFTPISFEFEKGEIISSDIQEKETKPENLIDQKDINTFFQVDTHSVSFPKFAFNPMDQIQFAIILSGHSEFAVNGRIREGKIIEFNPTNYLIRLISRRDFFSIISALVFFICLIIIMYLAITGNTFDKLPTWTIQLFFGSLLASYIFFIPMIYYTVKIIIEKRRIKTFS